MNERLHIVFLPSWYPKNSQDIGGIFFRDQAVALSNFGHQMGVIAPPTIYSLKKTIQFIKNRNNNNIVEDEGVVVYRKSTLNYTPKMKSINNERWLSISESLFDEYIDIHGLPDILHVHSMVYSGKLALRLSNKYNIPYVVTEHSSVFARKLIDEKSIQELSVVVDNAKACLAVSQEFKCLLNSIFYTDKWGFLPNSVDQQFLDTIIQPNQCDGLNLISVSMLNKNKNINVLIKAFSIVFKGNLNVHLNIVGDGPEKNELIRLVQNEGLNAQIKFLGLLGHYEVKHKIATSDALVLSSNYETFGVVIIEALALGKPVVATKCGGPESIINSEVGYLVEKNSVDSMAEGLRKLYRNRHNFSQEKIRGYCENNFSERLISNKLTEIYIDILHGSIS